MLEDRVRTGDTLLLGTTGRTDLPTGNPEALHDSLFHHLLALDGSLLVYPPHNYQDTRPTTLAQQRATNPRLQRTERGAFVEQMQALQLKAPDHLTQALRTNITGGRTVDQIIQEAAERISFMTMRELHRRIGSGAPGIAILDVREADASLPPCARWASRGPSPWTAGSRAGRRQATRSRRSPRARASDPPQPSPVPTRSSGSPSGRVRGRYSAANSVAPTRTPARAPSA